MAMQIKTKDLDQINKLLSQNEDDKVFNLASKLITKYPGHPLFFNIKGFILFKKERHAEAIPFFKEAIKREPLFLDAYNNLALSSYALRDINSAVENFQKVIEIDPKNYSANVHLGQIYYTSNYYGDAKPYIEKLVETYADGLL